MLTPARPGPQRACPGDNAQVWGGPNDAGGRRLASTPGRFSRARQLKGAKGAHADCSFALITVDCQLGHLQILGRRFCSHTAGTPTARGAALAGSDDAPAVLTPMRWHVTLLPEGWLLKPAKIGRQADSRLESVPEID